MLSNEQVEKYREEGYLGVEGVLSQAEVAEIRAVTDEFVENSRSISESDDVFDLEATHTAEYPQLRRLKNPADQQKKLAVVDMDEIDDVEDALRRAEELADITGRSKADVVADLLDDGQLNYSAGQDAEPKKDLLDIAQEKATTMSRRVGNQRGESLN